MAKLDKKPEIRFKGFTDDWELHELVEISDIVAGGDIDNTKICDDGKYPVIANALVNDGILGYYKEDYRIKAPAITVTGRGEVGHAQARNVDFTPVVRLIALKTKHNNSFIANAINTKKIIIESTGVPQLTVPQLEKYQIPTTSDLEEKKIGTFFDKLENLITLQQRKCDKLVNIKETLLDKMFPKNGVKKPEIRFKEFGDDWEEHKLEECIEDLKSGLSRMLSEEDIGLPVVRANNIEDDKLNMSREVKFWYKDDPQGANTLNYLIKKGDILINFINSETKMGTAAIVENIPIRDTIYTTNILKMQVNNKCNNHFFLAQTHTKSYKEYIKGISKIAVNQASFTTVDFKNFDINIPTIKEQTKIGMIFRIIDNLITLQQQKCEKLKNIKKALLNKMFI